MVEQQRPSLAKKCWLEIDYQISNYENAIKAKKAYVYKDERFSDHAPLIIEYK